MTEENRGLPVVMETLPLKATQVTPEFLDTLELRGNQVKMAQMVPKGPVV